ncbi:uncharacterized protein [Euphorbia lathyris]|uniref:uncharacterized protein isoform X2 n=1 Tax=Euphorbia lathyris TaxID=212925 RepID=UPI00331356AA
METFRLRKSNSAASTDDRSRRLKEGNRQVQKQRNFPQLASDSSPQNSDTIGDYSVKCESGCTFSKQATGTPIKKLLAEEMSRETEAKKRSPSVIAKLMGFDGLPPQQLSNNQPKRSMETYQQRMASTEKSQRSSTSCTRRSSRRSSKEEQEFKDVFEVSDSSKVESSCFSMQGPAKSKLTGAEMAYVKQKFLDVTRLSTDDKFHDSEEFLDAIEDLHSNKDLLLKYLEQPDSLFTKHLHDLQADPLPSHCSHISGMKLLSAQEHEGSALGRHRKNHFDPLSHSNNKHAAENAHFKLSKIQAEGKVESSVLSTRIVVLKPNCGKLQNAIRTVSSPQSSHDFLSDCKRHSELSSVKDREVESCGKRRFSNDAMLPRYKSKESREIAKEITRQMRNRLERGRTKLSFSGAKGYAGDDSSSNRSDNESANESDVPTLVSKNSINWSNRYRPSSSRSAESSVSKEARKRLSERWKMTHRSLDMEVFSRGSTLGEMLAMPDREGRPANADAMVGEKGLTDKFVNIDRPAGLVEPLGISSSDGWKDGRHLSRSRSVPASCTTSGSPRTGMLRETLCNEKYLLPKEVARQERIKLAKGKFNHREASSSRNSRSHTKKSHFSVHSYTDYSDTSPEIQFSRKKVQSRMMKDDHIEQAVVTDSRLVFQDAVNVAIENASMPSKPNTDVESPVYMMAKDNSSTVSQESSFAPPEEGSVPMQHSAAELESPGNSKEAEQPSPVSILETPFPDDVSSNSECFESLSADLHGLRMQLQLLKLESESYEEGGMIISSDEENEISEEQARVEESKEFCYVKDVLTESGINVADQDSFMASLHAAECPVNPLVFEELEKHWGSGCWPRCERNLLFDRVNSALVVIKQQFGDTHPWVKPGSGSVSRWTKNGVLEKIEKLLEIQEKNAYKDDAAVTDRQWVDVRDDIDVVGREIEKLVMEDLVNEIVEVIV